MEKYEIIIIGAGQAGLAMGYFLQQKNTSFIVIDSNPRVGDSWRNRYDSLVLFTPKKFSGLPGYSFPGNPHAFPTKDETADYLESYAKRFSIPIHLHTQVRALEWVEKEFIVSTNNKTYCAKKVVVATGPFQKPLIPAVSKQLTADIVQLHSSDYRNPSQLKEGNVLVVGGGNSGAQIAVELSRVQKTFLSVSQPIKFMPLQILDLSVFGYFDRLGLLQADVSSRRGMWLKQQREKVYGLELKKLLKSGQVIQKPRVGTVSDESKVGFADGSELEVQNIIWSTGFQMDYSWIHIDEAFDHNRQPKHQKGLGSVQGLYFLGLPWLSSRGSALIGWVGHDAQRLIPYLSN